jgi:signal transduction histidine kinase
MSSRLLASTSARRILVVDDNRAIHDDFRKVLAPRPAANDLDAMEADLFGEAVRSDPVVYELDDAYQGAEGLERVRAAVAQGRPYAMAFVDIRMPPGWDGIETIERLWREDRDLEIVICSAYSDYSWDDIVARLGRSDSLLILQKPFDNMEVQQLAHALTEKWRLRQEARDALTRAQALVEERTRELREANDRLIAEMRQRRAMETELRLAQKLEAVGRLAAGVAHEINTPLQYVTDNVRFMKDTFVLIMAVVSEYRNVLERVGSAASSDPRAEVAALEKAVDFEFVHAEIPQAMVGAEDGLSRVANIVRALRRYAHPDGDKRPADLNRALLDALEVSRHQYKYVAEVTAELAELPPVTCLVGELSQVFVNLIVNAAHAIEAHRTAGGRIAVTTRVEGDDVVVSIGDNGCGIPPDVRERIFDPFFTTKEVDVGSGQGLAIAWSIVVERHGGSITFDTEVGMGTTFHLKIPIGTVDRAEAR